MRKTMVSGMMFCFLIAACLAGDWPQLQCNPQRTGYTPEVIAPAGAEFPFAWEFCVLADDRIALAVQAIIIDDTVYFGTMAGKFFALELTTGKPKWSVQLGGPVMNTAGFAGGKVFVPCLDGNVYALDPATGETTWKTGVGPISTAVLLVGDSVYVTTRPGELVRLRQTDGGVVWRYAVDAPVYGTPSLDNGMVFFVDDALRLHCVDAETGKPVRPPTLAGGGRNYPPVLSHGLVFITNPALEPLRPEADAEQPPERQLWNEDRNKVWYAPRNQWPGPYRQWVEATEAYRTARGESFKLAALDQRTGEPVKFFPNSGTQSMAVPHPPPAITPEGIFVFPMEYCFWNAEIGLFLIEEPGLVAVFITKLGVSHDETQDFSIAADIVFTFHTWGIGECGTQEAFNLKTGERYSFAGRPGKGWPPFKSAGPSNAAALGNEYIVHNVNHRIAAWKGAQ